VAFAVDNLHADGFWPSIQLPDPGDPETRTYLGIAPGTDIRFNQIKARLVVVQIFSMYCSICQREAPRVNRLFSLLSAKPETAEPVKLIGIGVGNSAFEVEFFRKSYKIPFPLFADGDFSIHKKQVKRERPTFVS
jgi:peroxiredoxin